MRIAREPARVHAAREPCPLLSSVAVAHTRRYVCDFIRVPGSLVGVVKMAPSFAKIRGAPILSRK
jgi:hypothetical protein